MSGLIITHIVKYSLQWLIAAIIVFAFVCVSVGVVSLMMYAYRRLMTCYEQMKEKGRDCTSIITICVAAVIGVALIVLIIIIVIRANNPSCLSDFTMTRLGLFGDYFGGFIGTLVAVIVAIYAIRTYISEREQQKEASVSAMLSTMLDLHKQNVSEIQVVDRHKPPRKLNGREAFSQLVEELHLMFDIVYGTIIEEVNKEPEFYQEWTSVDNQKRLAHVLSYGYFFYQVDTYVITNEAGSPLFFLCEKVRESVQSSIDSKNFLALQRHIILGHYYRHLFNMVNFIDKNTFTDKYEKKEFYVKLIRSQLSDYEQILLYYNALSTLGAEWNKPIGENTIDKMSLICKYRLIKNCPLYIPYFGISPWQDMYKAEQQAWWNQKKELFFETDPQGQIDSFNEILNL